MMRICQREAFSTYERCFGAPLAKEYGVISVMGATLVLVGEDTLWIIWTGDHRNLLLTSPILIDIFLVSCGLSTYAKQLKRRKSTPLVAEDKKTLFARGSSISLKCSY